MTKSTSAKITNESLTNADWYKIACKIRDQNRELKIQISELEELLSNCQQSANEQIIAVEKKDILIECQQQQITNLNKELSEQINLKKPTNSEEQKLELLIDNLSQELQQVQQQAARLERECSFLQDKYNQQEHLLKQQEKENQELQIRLQRQQRYNLQYKSALDQYLQSNVEEEKNYQQNLNPSLKKEGIKPWHEAQIEGNLARNSERILPKILNSLNPSAVKQETNIQQNQENDIPELIYDNSPNSTEDKIENLIEEIDQEMQTIMENQSQITDNHKKLNLPPIINTNDNFSITSSSGQLESNFEQINSQDNDSHQDNQPHRFLKLPKFGK
jgi:hypothetical protein